MSRTFQSLFFIFAFSLVSFVGSFASGKTLDFKPLSIEVQKQDTYLVRGFKGKIKLQAQKGNRVTVSLKQTQPANLSSEMKDIVEEWLFSVQRKDNTIEILVRSPHSKTSWEKTLQNHAMPNFEMQISGPPKLIDLALREGSIDVESWAAPITVYAQKAQVSVNGGDGELKLSLQEGSAKVTGRKGDVSIDSYSAKVICQGNEGRLRVVNFSGNSNIDSHQGPLEVNGYQGEFEVTKGRGRVDFDVDRSTVKIVGRSGDVRGKSVKGPVIASLSGEADVRVTTEEANVSLNLSNSGAQVNVGTEEGQIYAPNYLRQSRLPTMKLIQGRMRGKESGQVYVRSQSGSIRLR